jgi:hypothetical protein
MKWPGGGRHGVRSVAIGSGIIVSGDICGSAIAARDHANSTVSITPFEPRARASDKCAFDRN